MNSPLNTAAVALVALAAPLTASAYSLESFGKPGATGAVIVGSTWEGNITQSATTLTVGGTALDDNGWQWIATGAPIDATDMAQLSLTASRNTGNQAQFIFVQFEDIHANTVMYTFDTSAFATGTLTTVNLDLHWTGGFDYKNITGWTLGGGDPFGGGADMRMTFDQMSFSLVAIPEPATYAALPGIALALALVRRRKRAASAR